jgi:hypothetical protein
MDAVSPVTSVTRARNRSASTVTAGTSTSGWVGVRSTYASSTETCSINGDSSVSRPITAREASR